MTCLINDLSELEMIRKQQDLHGELSAEMALQLRVSLATIAGYAQQLASNRDPDLATANRNRHCAGGIPTGSESRRIFDDEAVGEENGGRSRRRLVEPARSGQMQEAGRKTECGEGEAMNRIANMEWDLR